MKTVEQTEMDSQSRLYREINAQGFNEAKVSTQVVKQSKQINRLRERSLYKTGLLTQRNTRNCRNTYTRGKTIWHGTGEHSDLNTFRQGRQLNTSDTH